MLPAGQTKSLVLPTLKCNTVVIPAKNSNSPTTKSVVGAWLPLERTYSTLRLYANSPAKDGDDDDRANSNFKARGSRDTRLVSEDTRKPYKPQRTPRKAHRPQVFARK